MTWCPGDKSEFRRAASDTLKVERVWQKDYANHAEAITDVADDIVNFYNAVRLHSTLGNLSPIAVEPQPAAAKLFELSEKTWPPHLKLPHFGDGPVNLYSLDFRVNGCND